MSSDKMCAGVRDSRIVAAMGQASPNCSNSFVKLINEFADNYTESEYSVDLARKLNQKVHQCTGGSIKVIDDKYDALLGQDVNSRKA